MTNKMSANVFQVSEGQIMEIKLNSLLVMQGGKEIPGGENVNERWNPRREVMH